MSEKHHSNSLIVERQFSIHVSVQSHAQKRVQRMKNGMDVW